MERLKYSESITFFYLTIGTEYAPWYVNIKMNGSYPTTATPSPFFLTLSSLLPTSKPTHRIWKWASTGLPQFIFNISYYVSHISIHTTLKEKPPKSLYYILPAPAPLIPYSKLPFQPKAPLGPILINSNMLTKTTKKYQNTYLRTGRKRNHQIHLCFQANPLPRLTCRRLKTHFRIPLPIALTQCGMHGDIHKEI